MAWLYIKPELYFCGYLISCEGFIVDLPEGQEAAGGMEGQGGNAAKAAGGVG